MQNIVTITSVAHANWCGNQPHRLLANVPFVLAQAAITEHHRLSGILRKAMEVEVGDQGACMPGSW